MATVTRPSGITFHAEPTPRVKHPLERLRGYIRTYVSLEGLAALLLFLSLWFWIGLVLDYGFFKLFTIDWVQELPWGLRAVILAVLSGAAVILVVTKVATRLLREFHNDALALVLERRFPDKLGDRLITAVELADVKRAATYGYSTPMIEQTIQEAVERVEQIPVHEAFDWKRLRRHWLQVALVSVGFYILTGMGYGVVRLAAPQWATASFVSGFNDVAAIWFERNILLQNTIWPRKAHLELVSFDGKPILPESELKIGRDASPPALRVRALKWVIADKNAPEGWRAMTWDDAQRAKLLAADLSVPDDWKPRNPSLGLTVDEIELNLDKTETHRTLSPEADKGLRDLLANLEEKVSSPSMSRKMRKLDIPDTVYVVSKSSANRSEMTLQKQGDNEYTGVFSDLRETVRFSARGEDYSTAYRQIIVVPPPTLNNLARDEEKPAYLYYRVPRGATVADLRGKRQIFKGAKISLMGEKSAFTVPAGTNVVLTATSDKPLQSVRILPPRKGQAPVDAKPGLESDGLTFTTRFDNIRATVDLIFEFIDTDGVVGLRRVEIKPIEDLPPEINVAPDVVRKTQQGYMVTPQALIPFTGTVRDDNGLDSVDYVYTLARLAAGSAQEPINPVVASVSGLVSLSVGQIDQSLGTASFLAATVRELRVDPTEKEDKAPKTIPVASVVEKLRARQVYEVPESLAKMMEFLGKDPRDIPDEKDRWPMAILKSFAVETDDPLSGFDLQKLPRSLRVGQNEIQPRYKMQLWMSAIDTDIETDPGATHGKEGVSREKFTFLIVSEDELLSEIGKEEEGLHLKLDDVVKRLSESKGKLDQINQALAGTPKAEEYNPLAVRGEEIDMTREKSFGMATEVHADYRRILRELITNRVQEGMRKRVENQICDPLRDLLQGEFARAEEAVAELRKALESTEPDLAKRADKARTNARAAAERYDLLIRGLANILDNMQKLITINKLIDILVKIQEEEQVQYQLLDELRLKKEKALLEGLLGDDKPPPKKDDKPPMKKKDEEKK
jgi:hypothetical protein